MDFKDRSKAIFERTLFDLLKSKDMDQITVTEICKTCHTSRKTFYKYFRDKYDLLTWTLEDIFAKSFENETFLKLENATNYYQSVKNNSQFWRKELFENNFDLVLHYSVELGIKKYRALFEPYKLTSKQMYALKVYIYGNIFMLREWVESNFKESTSEIAQNAIYSFPNDLKHYFNDKHKI